MFRSGFCFRAGSCAEKCLYMSELASVAALPPPRFETLSMADLLRYQADHLDFCCVSTTVYLDLVLLCICRCVSATVSTVLYIRHCICYCISTTVSAVLYIHCCICHSLSAAVYLPLCLLCCISAIVYLPLCIRPCVSAPVNVYLDPVLYIWQCIHRCVSAAVYISATVYPPLYIGHCICCIIGKSANRL
jgi:hypothetical protein